MRFSPVMGTMSEAMLTAVNSSNFSRSANGKLLLLANACMNLNPTPHPDRCSYG